MPPSILYKLGFLVCSSLNYYTTVPLALYFCFGIQSSHYHTGVHHNRTKSEKDAQSFAKVRPWNAGKTGSDGPCPKIFAIIMACPSSLHFVTHRVISVQKSLFDIVTRKLSCNLQFSFLNVRKILL